MKFFRCVAGFVLPMGMFFGVAQYERPFLDANDAAMKTMMTGMAIHPTGDVDADFAAMMIPHHQGAIDMAKAELQFGRDPVLRRLAQSIIVEQQQEIELMRRQLQRLSPPPQCKDK